MANITNSSPSEFGKCLVVAPIRRQLGYLYDYHSNVEHLESQLKELEDVKGGVDQSVDAARRDGEEIDPDVENWLENVNGITREARKFLDGEKTAEKWCFRGLCPNLKSRYQLSKKAKKTAAEVVQIQDGGKFDNVSYSGAQQGMGYVDFESRKPTLKGIMEALMRTDINMIGVYGVEGVGKTVLMKEVAKRIKEEKLFDEVVMIVVSQTPNIRNIQGEIGSILGLKFDQEDDDQEDDEYDRADRLRNRLKKKNILVILDDIWARLDLEEIGIPIRDYQEGKDDRKRCKVVLISRNEETLRNEKITQMNFLVEVLLEEEAWDFFKKMAGYSVEAPELKPTAIEVAKECACSPIAVATVANALKNKSLQVWKDALQQLRSSTSTYINGMDIKLCSSLELSYNFLESEQAKSIFLLCCLLPKDYHISIQDILKYGNSLDLFQDVNTLEQSRHRVHKLIHDLKASCLLLDSDIVGSVKIHEAFCDVGKSIASKEKHISIVKNGADWEECMEEEKLKICPAISLLYKDIHKFPTGLECPKLNSFLFFCNDPSMKIPDTFFEGMKQLRVLNLTNICFSSLPSSLIFLSNLQTLCLHQCVLRDILVRDLAKIGELRKLEILCFESSNIEELPREIGQLTLLKLLDLRNCSKLKSIPSNVLASLSQLEDLYMGNSFTKWEVDGNASLAELKRLSRLVTLDIGITDAKILPKDLGFEKLKRYKIFVGDVWDWSGEYQTSRTLKIKLNTSIQQESGIKMLMRRTEDLYLFELKGIISFLNELDKEGFPRLKHLHVQSSSEIEYVINTMEWVPNRAFPNLKSLFLFNLINLRDICHGRIPVESFCNLRTVEVEHCDRLKNLFSLSMARSLLLLEAIKVTECDIIDKIVADGREEGKDNDEAMDKIMFPQLRYLTLQHLPKLMGFYSNLKTMPSVPLFNKKVAFSNLEELVVSNSSFLQYIFDLGGRNDEERNVVRANELRYLQLLHLPSLMQIWKKEDSRGINSFQRLSSIEIHCCPNLRNIFTISLAKSLVQLQKLSISLCYMVKEIVENEGEKEEAIDEEVFPQVTSLTFHRLVQLKSFCQGISIFKWPSLKKLEVSLCFDIEIFSSEAEVNINIPIKQPLFLVEKVAFPNLEELTLKYSANMKEIWQGQFHALAFGELRVLRVIKCRKILKVFPINLLQNFQNLEVLTIDDCSSLEVVLELREVSREIWKKDSQRISPFQNLTSLHVALCSNLRNIFATSLAKVEEIVEKEGEEEEAMDDKIVFPQLTHLILEVLPQLKSFCHGIHISEWPSLKKLMVNWCRNVEIIFAVDLSKSWEEERRGKGHVDDGTPTKKPLFLVDKIAFPKLEGLEFTWLLNMKQIWLGQFHPPSFCNLRVLYIWSCDSLTHLLPSAIVKSLVQIESIQVGFCDMMKEIIAIGEEEATNEITLGQLKSLKLEGLPNLATICRGSNTLSFPSLEEVLVEDCPELKTFSNGILNTPKLDKEQIQHLIAQKDSQNLG